MNKYAKDITPETTSYLPGEFTNEYPMVQKLPPQVKAKVLKYLKEGEPVLAASTKLKDPITGKIFAFESIVREKDGYSWATGDIYMLEHYDIKLRNEFLQQVVG